MTNEEPEEEGGREMTDEELAELEGMERVVQVRMEARRVESNVLGDISDAVGQFRQLQQALAEVDPEDLGESGQDQYQRAQAAIMRPAEALLDVTGNGPEQQANAQEATDETTEE